LEQIAAIRKDMEKDQYYLLCQYAIGILEAKAKIIDEQLSMKYGRGNHERIQWQSEISREYLCQACEKGASY